MFISISMSDISQEDKKSSLIDTLHKYLLTLDNQEKIRAKDANVLSFA